MRIAAALVCLLAAPAAASPCGPVPPGAETVGRFEAAVLAGDGAAGAAELPTFPDDVVKRMLADFRSAPFELTRCEVIFEEAMPPAILRRATAFLSKDGIEFLLYVDAIRIAGRTEIAYVAYNPDFTVILDLIR